MKKRKEKKIYAFIDSQNLNLGIRSQGWQLDFNKFRVYLKDKYNVSKAFLFIGHIPKYEKMYSKLKTMGYTLIFKPTIGIKVKGKKTFKGNVDAELVLYAVDLQDKYDKAIIVSGDGDFYCLHEYLEKKKKLLRILIPNKKFYSALLRRFVKNYVEFLSSSKHKKTLKLNKK